jgi:hypothetical protein
MKSEPETAKKEAPAPAPIFEKEIAEAVKAYDKFIVCLNRTPEEFKKRLDRSVAKAMETFNNRPEGTRMGINTDEFVTVHILLPTGAETPVCGIYFNLSSPFTEAVKSKRNPSKSEIKDDEE